MSRRDLPGSASPERPEGRTETARSHRATEALGEGRLGEEVRSHKASEDIRTKGLSEKIGKTQQQQQLATTQMKTLADRARRLYQAVEENPSLVGARGFGQRMIGGIGEQLGVTHEDPAVADFKAQVSLLQAQLQKPLLGARYFSGKAQEQMSALVPALARLDNPTAVKSALRNLAEVLESTAGATEAAGQGVGARLLAHERPGTSAVDRHPARTTVRCRTSRHRLSPRDRGALLGEAYKRGVLPPQQRGLYEEGLRRGLFKAQEPAGAQTAPAAPAATPDASGASCARQGA